MRGRWDRAFSPSRTLGCLVWKSFRRSSIHRRWRSWQLEPFVKRWSCRSDYNSQPSHRVSLPTGSFFVRSIGFSRTALAIFPKIELGPYLSDEEVSRRLAAEFSWLERNTIFSPAKSNDIQPLPYLEIL